MREAADVVKKLDNDEKMLVDREIFEQKSDLTLSVGSGNLRPGPVKKWFVNEPGLYLLLLRSDKPEAKPFKRWVVHEVLPEIRKYGKYLGSPIGNSLPTSCTHPCTSKRGFHRV